VTVLSVLDLPVIQTGLILSVLGHECLVQDRRMSDV